jgi:O-antigen ligase
VTSRPGGAVGVATTIGLGTAAAVLLGFVAVALPPAAKVVLLAVGAISLTGWATWRLVVPALNRAHAWRAALSGGKWVDVVLLWLFVEAGWAGLWRGPGGLRIADLLVLGLGAYALVGIRTAPPAVRRVVAVLAGAFGLVLVGALLAGLEQGLAASDVEAVARAGFAMLLVPAVVVRFIQSERRFEAVLLATVVSVAVASIAAVAAQATDAWILPFADDFGGRRSYGLSNHPALFGIAAAAALPLGVALALPARERERGRVRVVAVLCLPMLLVGLVLSASRAPLVAGVLAVLGLLFALRTGGRRGRVALALMLVAMAAAAAAVFPERLERLSDEGAQQSALARVELLSTALSDVGASPIVGCGARVIKGDGGLEPSDSYWAGSTVALRVGGGRGDGDAGAHNLLLQTWRALGLPGLMGLAMAVIAGLVAGLRAIRSAPERMRGLVGAVLASLGVVLGCLMIFDAVFERQLWLTVGLLCALGVAAPTWARDSLDPEPAGSEAEVAQGPVASRARA